MTLYRLGSNKRSHWPSGTRRVDDRPAGSPARAVDPSMETLITDDRNAVVVAKSVTSGPKAVTVRYCVESVTSSDTRIKLVEHLPEPVEQSRVVFPTEDDPGDWEYLDGGRLAYEVELSRSDTVETAATVARATDPDGLTTDVTVVDPGEDNERGQTVASDGFGPVGLVTNGQGERHRAPEFDALERTAPAVGVVAADDVGAVAETTVAATDRGLDVFVVGDAESESSSVRVARRLGATKVDTGIDDPDEDAMRTSLAVAARSRSYPGVVVVTDPSRGIDVDGSLSAFESTERTVVPAVTPVTRPTTVAGIPAYNEADTVGTVVEEASAFVDEVVVVDDGSTDGTADRAREAGATVVEHGRNRGYGHALKTLFEAADDRAVDHLVVLDADSQHDPADIPRLVRAQREAGANLVIGNRFGGEGATGIPLYRRFGLGVIGALVNLGMGGLLGADRVSDAQSGFRAYDRDAIASLAANTDTIDDRMGASTDILSHAFANDFEIAEVPTTMEYDVANANTRNPIRHGMMVVESIATTLERERPLTVLGIPGVALALVGIAVEFRALSQTVTTATAPLGLVVLGGVLGVVGLLVSFASVLVYSFKTLIDDQGSEHGTP